MILDKKTKEMTLKYVMATGFYKTRVADYLAISRPTFDKILENDPVFFTALKAADAVFCKDLIMLTAKKNPSFLLKTKYKDEFNDDNPHPDFNPEEELKKIDKIIQKYASD